MRRLATVITAVAAGVLLPLATSGTAAAAESQPLTSFSFVSEPGDYIGGGQTKAFTAPASNIRLFGTGDGVRLSVFDDNAWWDAEIAPPRGEKLRPGRYYDAERAAFREGRAPGLDVGGDGRGCNTVWGEFAIDQIAYDASGAVTLLEATFLQRCGSETAPALRGALRYQAFPQYYKFASDKGDYIGGGVTKAYTGSTTIFGLSGNNRAVSFSVSGQRDDWNVDLAAPAGGVLAAGTYQGAKRYPFNDGAPGLSVSGNGRGCNTLTGTFVIHEIRFDAEGDVQALSADYEQHCEGLAPALKGSIRYNAGPWPTA